MGMPGTVSSVSMVASLTVEGQARGDLHMRARDTVGRLRRRALLSSAVGVGIAAALIAFGVYIGLAGRAQAPRVARIGFIGSSLSNLAVQEQVAAFREGLRDAGWI
jgi:hypothetical protein